MNDWCIIMNLNPRTEQDSDPEEWNTDMAQQEEKSLWRMCKRSSHMIKIGGFVMKKIKNFDHYENGFWSPRDFSEKRQDWDQGQ